MAGYKEIAGTNIEIRSSNPDNPAIGQVWYNSTDDVLRYKEPDGANTWATGGNLNTGRRLLIGTGTQSSALACAGVSSTNTELYNGSSWTEVNDINVGRYLMAGFGTQSASIGCGGFGPPTGTTATESWNGSSWTEVNDLNTARGGSGSAGADNTSGLVFGGTQFINQCVSSNIETLFILVKKPSNHQVLIPTRFQVSVATHT